MLTVHDHSLGYNKACKLDACSMANTQYRRRVRTTHQAALVLATGWLWMVKQRLTNVSVGRGLGTTSEA